MVKAKGLFVDLDDSACHLLDGEVPGNPFGPGPTHALPQQGIGHQSFDSIRQSR